MMILEINTPTHWETIVPSLLEHGAAMGLSIIKALIILIVGKIVIKFALKLLTSVLDRQRVAPDVRTFARSLANIMLMILLIISAIGALGIQTTSFAALLASAGVAIGMALSGNLSNFAGGLIILIFKPLKVGDFISTSSGEGTVEEIQIFHTILRTSDNLRIYIPNGSLSSGAIKNYAVDIRRLEWIIGVEYDSDFEVVRQTIEGILQADDRILHAKGYTIELKELADSSVNILVRAWTSTSNFWDVFFTVNKKVYKTFNEKGIGFPFPQLTLHRAKDDQA